MDCIVHGVAKSRTRLRDFHFTSIHIHTHTQHVLKKNLTNVPWTQCHVCSWLFLPGAALSDCEVCDLLEL